MLSPDVDLLVNELLKRISADQGSPSAGYLDRQDPRKLYFLAQLQALAGLRDEIGRRIDATARVAVKEGATFQEVGEAAGVTKQRAHQRFGQKKT